MVSLGDVMRMAGMQCKKCGGVPAYPRVLCEKCYEPTQWQPIETVPKDGTRILTYRRDRNGKDEYHTAKCNAPDDDWTIPGYGIPEPSHWMPLPPPPHKTASETPLDG
jgi:hypothetical protein